MHCDCWPFAGSTPMIWFNTKNIPAGSFPKSWTFCSWRNALHAILYLTHLSLKACLSLLFANSSSWINPGGLLLTHLALSGVLLQRNISRTTDKFHFLANDLVNHTPAAKPDRDPIQTELCLLQKGKPGCKAYLSGSSVYHLLPTDRVLFHSLPWKRAQRERERAGDLRGSIVCVLWCLITFDWTPY